MKPTILISAAITLAACLLSGCGESSSTSNESAKGTSGTAPATTVNTASAPATVPATAPAQVTTTATPASTAPATPPSAVPAAALTDGQTPTTPTPDGSATVKNATVEPVSQFATTAAAQTDKVAASIGSELAAKAKSLTQSAAGNSELKTQVAGALQSLSTGKDASALTSLFQQAKQANLTPQQTQLSKEVGTLASAYVVQRNFSSLDGAQGDVATIVNSLRKGAVVPAVPALRSLAQNAALTSQQKDLLGTLADQYAPGLKNASDSLKQGLQGLTK
jgi:hypothetical protein